MLVWEHTLLVLISSISLISLLIMFICRYYCFKRPARPDSILDPAPPSPTLQDGIAKLHHRAGDEFLDSKRRGNYYAFKRGPSARPLFNWADHPSLITDAVENGWTRFGFVAAQPTAVSGSVRNSMLLGLCAASGDNYHYPPPEMSWEVSQASSDFMQRIRLNPGLKRVAAVGNPSTTAASVIRTALPLPGPSPAFPQEAYFEVTISYSRGGSGGGEEQSQRSRSSSAAGKGDGGGEGEKIKLIREIPNPNSNSAALLHVSSSQRINRIEELRVSSGGKDENRGDGVAVAVGLSVGGGFPPFKLPGSYHGSIGFNSNGSVYLDGLKLAFETEPSSSSEWARSDNRVIGCGYDPRQKKVFFTVDGDLVHVIHCKADEFGTPLYPTIAANSDAVAVVNLGQSAFSYAPANAQRTPNPCFVGGMQGKSPGGGALGYEDSRELFSMGRIDSQWLDRSGSRYSYSNGGGGGKGDVPAAEREEDSEADLFEIVLEGDGGESPNSVL
ncbi:unnamed protein product [Linum tenue]|uniref:SPRY domain-containing protein n=1 Tax=Linum tenue TaxID=586396 RepID=A0AAV0HV17_9ROSI|nr:unnamed protein product [Linum tenue]